MMKEKISRVLYSEKFILPIAILIPLIAGIKHATRGIFNDYRIFISSFHYCIDQINMYLYYPELNGWSYIYGPFFTILIAPFALLPESIGTVFWDLLSNLVLFIAIYYLPLHKKQKLIIFYFSLVAIYANAVNSQTNALIAALIIGSYIFILRNRESWAACFIAIGVFIKLYTIVGFAFIFFCKKKKAMIGYFILWSIIFFVLPMLISSPSYIFHSYQDWFHTLVDKNQINLNSTNQDISIMGLIRRVSGYSHISNLYFILPGVLLFALQFVNRKLYNNERFQLDILSVSLISVVLFSSGSEHCTYIIAVVGALIWIVNQKDFTVIVKALIAILIIVELLSSGIGPSFVRKTIIRPYAIEALPFFLIWFYILIVNCMRIIRKNKVRDEVPVSTQK